MPYLFLEGFDKVPETGLADSRAYFQGKNYTLFFGGEFPAVATSGVLPGRVRGGKSVRFLGLDSNTSNFIGTFVPAGSNKVVVAFGAVPVLNASNDYSSPVAIQFDNLTNAGILLKIAPDQIVLGIRGNLTDGAAGASGNLVFRKDLTNSGFRQFAIEADRLSNRVKVYVDGVVQIDVAYALSSVGNFRAVMFGGGEARFSNNITNTAPTGTVTLNPGVTTVGGYSQLDDIYASYDEAYAGDLVVRSLVDNGPVTNTGVLTGASVPAALASNDGDTSFVALQNNGQSLVEQYAGDLLPADTVVAVSVVATSRRTDSELVEQGAAVDVGGGVVGQQYQGTGLTYAGRFFIWNNNPGTGLPFTANQVNNLRLTLNRRTAPL